MKENLKIKERRRGMAGGSRTRENERDEKK